MGTLAGVGKRRQQYADGFSTFAQGERREKHQARKFAREWHQEVRGEESLGRWAWALDLHPVAAGVSGCVPRWSEERLEEEQRHAAQALAEQYARNDAAARWYTAQLQQGQEVTTQELAARLGAVDEAHGRALLDAWAFDLFHLHRHLWRALKLQQGKEAGLSAADALLEAQREEAALESLTARPVLPAAPERLKRPRPIEYRPEVQPNAPTN